MQLKPTIAEMTAIAEAAKLANSKLPQDVKNSVDYSTSNEVKINLNRSKKNSP